MSALIPSRLAFFRLRLRHRMHELVLWELLRHEEAGTLTRAALAERLGKTTAQLDRLLARPSTWRLETLTDLLVGMCIEPSAVVLPALLEVFDLPAPAPASVTLPGSDAAPK